MARQRDYQAEYRARVERALARGLSPAQGYGKPAKGETSVARLAQAGQLPPAPPPSERPTYIGRAAQVERVRAGKARTADGGTADRTLLRGGPAQLGRSVMNLGEGRMVRVTASWTDSSGRTHTKQVTGQRMSAGQLKRDVRGSDYGSFGSWLVGVIGDLYGDDEIEISDITVEVV